MADNPELAAITEELLADKAMWDFMRDMAERYRQARQGAAARNATTKPKANHPPAKASAPTKPAAARPAAKSAAPKPLVTDPIAFWRAWNSRKPTTRAKRP